MFPKWILLFLSTVMMIACQGESGQLGTQPSKPSQGSPDLVGAQTSSDVKIRILGNTLDGPVMELRNDTNHPIFVSYVPPKEGTSTTFLSYSIQRRTHEGDSFEQYGEGFHTVPNLHPISPRTTVGFRLVARPKEKGEYRVQIGYYDDEEVYRMVSERLVDMSDVERKRADDAGKHVFSDSFFVPAASDKR